MPKSKPMPPVEALEEWFVLDRNEGKLYWRKKPTRQVPRLAEAGWKQMHGPHHPRWSVNVPGYGRFLRSRIIWKMVTGNDPGAAVDHLNGDSLDDRFENLVDGGSSWNNRNRHKRRHTSEFVGAYPSNGGKQWMVTIGVNGKTKYIGSYRTPQEASAVYLAVKAQYEKEARGLT
jgi:hypothetical protein